MIHVQQKIVRVACGLVFTSPRKTSLFDLFCDRKERRSFLNGFKPLPSQHSYMPQTSCNRSLLLHTTAVPRNIPVRATTILSCKPRTMRCHLQAEAGWTAAIPATSPTLRQPLLEIPEHSPNPNTTFNVGTQFHVSDTLRL